MVSRLPSYYVILHLILSGSDRNDMLGLAEVNYLDSLLSVDLVGFAS